MTFNLQTATEDIIRDRAREILGLEDSESARAGVGQLTTFSQLGFDGENNRPDGWYLPNETSFPAVILETKRGGKTLGSKEVAELLRNCRIVAERYSHHVGILWNGEETRVFRDFKELSGETELHDLPHYLGLFGQQRIDKGHIYAVTKRINDSLHFDFGIKNLYERMIFTACALVAKRYGATLAKGMSFNVFSNSIKDKLAKSYDAALRQNVKLNILLDVYSAIRMNYKNNQKAIDDFIANITEISDCLNSDFWHGEDVMAIFFNEFNRYKKKSEQGQVFTPDHITSLMCRVLGVGRDDCVLDAACGSGAFLVKAMCNMIQEAGGVRTAKAHSIREAQLFGIEFDKEIYALACANMLIHKDGKTNLECEDSRSEEAARWIRSKPITKVLMNPPFERKYGCLKIVANVLGNVRRGTPCAFIMPDTKLVKEVSTAKRMLKSHHLTKIIKLPEATFPEAVSASIFIFEAGVPQKGKPIFCCRIDEDGLETVKNQGRLDLRNRWPAIEDYWVDIIYKQGGDVSIRWIQPEDNLCYPVPKRKICPTVGDFTRRIVKYALFVRGVDENEFNQVMLDHCLYGEHLPARFAPFLALSKARVRAGDGINQAGWREFTLKELFDIEKGKRLTKANMREGNTPFIGATAFNNGVTVRVGNEGRRFPPNVLTVCYNGSIGETFYQTEPFLASDDVNVLRPKFKMNCYIAMFFATLIRLEGANYAYTDKWQKKAMEDTNLLLPCKGQEPDWKYMEQFIKSLSANLIAPDDRSDFIHEATQRGGYPDDYAPEEPRELPDVADESWQQ